MPYPTRRRRSPHQKKSRADLAAEFAALLLIGDAWANRQQTAAWLGVSNALLERWAWDGTGIPYTTIGRAVRYRVSDVLAYAEARMRRSTSDTGMGL